MKRFLPLVLALLSFSLFAETPDTILLHGKVYTGDPAHFAQAIAIGGKRIMAVGTDAEIEALASHNTDRFDLNGAVVIPGLNDAHVQLAITPERQKVQTTESATFDEVRAALDRPPLADQDCSILSGAGMEWSCHPRSLRRRRHRVSEDDRSHRMPR